MNNEPFFDNNEPIHLQTTNVFCQTYSTGYLKRNLTSVREGHNFSIVHLNTRSFSRNFDEFSILLDCLKWQPEVVVLSETWFSDDNCSESPGYEGYHVYRTDRGGGGVSIYVKIALYLDLSIILCIQLTP